MSKVYNISDLNVTEKWFRMVWIANGGSEDVMDFLDCFCGEFEDTIDFVMNEIRYFLAEGTVHWDGEFNRESIVETFGENPIRHPRWKNYVELTDPRTGRVLIFDLSLAK